MKKAWKKIPSMLVTLNAGNAIPPGMALLSKVHVSAYWGKGCPASFLVRRDGSLGLASSWKTRAGARTSWKELVKV